MLRRGVLVGLLLLCCAMTAAGQRVAEAKRRLTAEYDVKFATAGSEPFEVQLKVSGPISKPLRTTVSGIGHYHLEIETTEIPGAEPQYVTKWNITERDDRGRLTSIVARPQIRSVGNIPASIQVGSVEGEVRTFQAAVYNSK